MSQFEVPSNEIKVGFTFSNTSNEFHISLAQEAFNNIVGSKSIVKLTKVTMQKIIAYMVMIQMVSMIQWLF